MNAVFIGGAFDSVPLLISAIVAGLVPGLMALFLTSML